MYTFVSIHCKINLTSYLLKVHAYIKAGISKAITLIQHGLKNYPGPGFLAYHALSS